MNKRFTDLNIDSLSLISILCEIQNMNDIDIKLEKLDDSWMLTPNKMIESILRYEMYK